MQGTLKINKMVNYIKKLFTCLISGKNVGEIHFELIYLSTFESLFCKQRSSQKIIAVSLHRKVQKMLSFGYNRKVLGVEPQTLNIVRPVRPNTIVMSYYLKFFSFVSIKYWDSKFNILRITV